MRVLMLSELYPPFIGGSEEYVRNLAMGLAQAGHEVAVATIAGDNSPAASDEDGVRVHRLRSSLGRVASLAPSGRPYMPPAPDPEVVAGLRRLIANERPQVVHAHNPIVASFLPLKAMSGAALVMTLHDYSIVCARRDYLYRGRECSGPGLAKCLRCAARTYGTARGELVALGTRAMAPAIRHGVDMFVPVSLAVAERNGLLRSGVAYEVVPNFVPDNVARDVDESHPALDQLPDGPFWLYVGALSPHKGVEVLLEAYAGAVGAPPLVIIGRSSAEAPRNLPADVRLLTDLPHPAVMAAWRRAALGIVPSLFPDPCPTVVLEAMAAGVPLVASRTGGVPELVVDGKTGLLVAPGNATELRTAMCRLQQNEAERMRMARAAKRRAPGFMARNVVPRIEAIYERLLG